MDGALISALAALGGSAFGGITPLISNYLIQRGMTEREMLSRELMSRQTLYSDFIQFGTKLYVSASTKEMDDADELVALYALISRMRLCASWQVIEAAEQFATQMTQRFGEAAMTIESLRNATLTNHIDPLNLFSSCCREELRTLLRHRSK
jgi:hypothetical protein